MQTISDIIQEQGISWPLIVAGCFGLFILIAGSAIDVVLLLGLRKRAITSRQLLERLQSRPWTLQEGGKIGVVITVLLVALLLSVQAGYHWYAISENQAMLVFLVLQTIIFFAGGIVLIVSAMKSRGVSWKKAFLAEQRGFAGSVRDGFVFCLAVMPPIAGLGWLYTQVLIGLGIEPEAQDVINLLAQPGQPVWLQAYLVLMAVVAAPIVEELLFRGVLLSAVSRHLGFVMSVISVSFLFAVIHCNIQSIVPLFVLALALSLGYVCSGSIVTAIAMHAIFNLINVAGIFLDRMVHG